MPLPASAPSHAPPVLSDEAERLVALRGLAILDTDPEPRFDALATLASRICGTPVALINFVDEDRQWSKASVGAPPTRAPRDVSICAHAIAAGDLLVIPDTRLDARTATNPYVTEGGLRFYAGATLRAPSGHTIGALCVVDRAPRTLDDFQQQALRTLADQLETELGLRAAALALERRNAELARLREVESRARDSQLSFLQEVVARAPVMVFTLDLDARFVLVEGGGLSAIGLLPSARGANARELYRDHAAALAVVERALRGEAFVTLLTFGPVHLDVHVTPLLDAAGALVGTLAIAVDATQRHAAELRVRVQRTVVDLVVAAGNLRRAAPDIMRVVMRSGDWDAGLFWRVPPQGPLEALQVSGTSGEPSAEALVALRELGARAIREGKPIWLSEQDQALHVLGWKSGLIVPLRSDDVTLGVLQFFGRAPRPVEHALLDLGTTLGRQLGEYVGRRRAQEALRGSEERGRMREELAAMIVHDLKNPLSVVATNLKFVMEELVTDDVEMQNAMADAASASQRALGLVEGLVAQIGLESGHFELDRREVDVGTWLEALMAPRRRAAEARRVELVCEVGAPLVAVFDTDLVLRVLDNLIDNGLRYVTAGGKVVVTAREANDGVRFTVGNSGPPIAPEHRQQIFGKYGQTSSQSNGRLNVGLGLYFCSLVARAHGGTIHVEDAPGLPVVFVLDVPRG